jgi:hypothetical protein
MFRIVTSLLALSLFTGAAVGASAQAPPPEGPPLGSNPYAQQPDPTTTTRPNPQMVAEAKKWFAQLQNGRIDRSQMESGPSANMNDATISNAQHMIGSLGQPVSFVQQRSGSQGGVNYALYLVTFRNGQKVEFLFAIDQQGKIASLGLGTPRQ